VFPPEGALVEVRGGQGPTAPIALEASGGVPPYRWNGQPLPDPPIGTATPIWRPEGPGFFRLSVSDSDGRAVSEEIRLR
jgi:penicillin-binding protein 1C